MKKKQSIVGTVSENSKQKINLLITNKGIAEDVSFHFGFSSYMYKDSRILNSKSEDSSKTLKFEFATLVSQTNRSSPIDEKGGLDSILPVR